MHFISELGDVDKIILSYLKNDYNSEELISSILDKRVQKLREHYALNLEFMPPYTPEDIELMENPSAILGDKWKLVQTETPNNQKKFFVLKDPSKGSQQRLIFNSRTGQTILKNFKEEKDEFNQ